MFCSSKNMSYPSQRIWKVSHPNHFLVNVFKPPFHSNPLRQPTLSLTCPLQTQSISGFLRKLPKETDKSLRVALSAININLSLLSLSQIIILLTFKANFLKHDKVHWLSFTEWNEDKFSQNRWKIIFRLNNESCTWTENKSFRKEIVISTNKCPWHKT